MIDTLSWFVVYPEIILLVMACVIAIVDLGVSSPRPGLTYVSTVPDPAWGGVGPGAGVGSCLTRVWAYQGRVPIGIGTRIRKP